jgi:hypothetical protein
MRIRFLLVVGATLCAYAEEDPHDLLLKVQAKVAASLDQLPRYLCTQTVDRAVYRPDDRKSGSSCEPDPLQSRTHLISTDRLRLDVAMAANVEMYSWVGEGRFDDRDLLDMVNDGAISSGSFGSYLTALFRTDSATSATMET